MARASAIALSIFLLSSACQHPLQAPGAVQIVRLPADPPPPGTYKSTLVPTPQVQRCQRLESGRDASKCLLETNDETAIPTLLEISAELEDLGNPLAPFGDEASAAVNAGTIATATSPKELLAMLGDPNPSTRGFALRALTTMLETQQHAPAFAESAAATGRACVPLLMAPEERVAVTAALCVEATKAATAGASLARTFAAHPATAVKAFLGPKLRAIPNGTLEEASLRRIAAFLETPMSGATQPRDVRAREESCRLLAFHAPDEAWVIAAARVAADELKKHARSDDLDSPAACLSLAESVARRDD